MNEYEIVREEFHQLQNTGDIIEMRINAIKVVRNGIAMAEPNLPPGLNGICIYNRKDGTLICEEAFIGGAVDGYARYFSKTGALVGEDYYEQGGVTQTRIFR